MPAIRFLSAIALIAVTLSPATGDEPTPATPERFTFVCVPRKGDMVLYPLAPGKSVANANQIIISCDSLRFSSQGHVMMTNATIETRDGKLVTEGELALHVDELPSISIHAPDGGPIRQKIEFIDKKKPTEPSK
jgi:hypothetical protein